MQLKTILNHVTDYKSFVFDKGIGLDAKTDAIDAQVISKYAEEEIFGDDEARTWQARESHTGYNLDA